MHQRAWRLDLQRCCHVLEDKGKQTKGKGSATKQKKEEYGGAGTTAIKM